MSVTTQSLEDAIEHARELMQSERLGDAAREYRRVLKEVQNLVEPKGKTLAVEAAFELFQLLGRKEDRKGQGDVWNILVEISNDTNDPVVYELCAKRMLALALELQKAGEINDVELWLRKAEELGKRSATPEGFSIAATALFTCAMLEGDGKEALRRVAAEVIDLGQRSGTTFGLQTAMAAAAGAATLEQEGGDSDKAQTYFQRAVELGTRSGTPEGLAGAARCASNLISYIDEKNNPRGYRKATRQLISRSIRLGTPYGFELAAKAAFNLAVHYRELQKKLARNNGASSRLQLWYCQQDPSRLGTGN